MMIKNIILLTTLITSNLLFMPISHAIDSGEKIDDILAQKNPPAGIVFEIVTGDANSLEWALPEVQNHIKALRKRFPKLEIAIVTHGSEQFALQTNKNKKYKTVHSLTQQLVKDENVPLHVCGTHASWRNVTEEDFPDYVDVAAAGPATINDYVSLGYILIIIEDT